MRPAEQERPVTLKETIPVANKLGECILWDDRRGHLLWTDILGKYLFIRDPQSGSLDVHEFDEELCAFALIDDSDDLLCAFKSGFALLDRHSGDRQWIHRIDNAHVVRLNDGRVDRQGRFWCGSLINNDGSQPVDGITAELLRMDADGKVSKHLDGIRVSNSICWSPDGTTMYFADSLVKDIWAFDFDVDNGLLSNRRVLATTPEAAAPDGSVVDAAGYLWNAEWGMGRVVRYAPDGSEDMVIQLPVSHVTCLCFGGSDLNELYVTTATAGLSDEQLASEPEAGNVFVYETSYQGLPENRFVNRIEGT